MASITSVISLFVLLLATYSYSLPIENPPGHGMPIDQSKVGNENKMHLMNEKNPSRVPNINKDETSAEQESGEHVPKDPMKPMPPNSGSSKDKESEKRYFIEYAYPTISYSVPTSYVYLRDVKEDDLSMNETLKNKNDKRAFLVYGNYLSAMPTYYQTVASPYFIYRGLNDTVKDNESTNKTERDLVLSYPYTHSYLGYLTSPNYYLLKREIEGDGKMSNDTESETKPKRAYVLYDNLLPMQTTTLLHEAVSPLYYVRDVKDNSTKDPLSQDKNDKRAWIYYDTLGTNLISMPSYTLGTTLVYRDVNDTVKVNETLGKDKRAIILSPYSHLYSPSYVRYVTSYDHLLLKREVEGEGKMEMKDGEVPTNRTGRAFYSLLSDYYVPSIGYYPGSYSRIMYLRDLNDNSTKDQLSEKEKDKRAILLDSLVESPRVMYTTGLTYHYPLHYTLYKRGSGEVNPPVKNEQGVKDESGSSMETATEFNRRAFKGDDESGEETSSIRPREMESNKEPSTMDFHRLSMLNQRPKEEPVINNTVPGKNKPINEKEKSDN